jgi:Ribosomal protein L11 methyltransferase (PrmA)
MRIEYHRTLIADKVRNEAFYKALKSVIVPGKTTVADIGAGTGLLGLMASKLGAKDVYLFETAEVAGVAAKILKANNAKNCHLFPCHSTEFQDPPRVDVVVSETLGNYAFEENMIDTLSDAKKRFLKDSGVIIPSRVAQFAVPVVAPRIDAELGVWGSAGKGLDLSIAETMSRNNVYVRTLKPGELLGGGQAAKEWDSVDFGNDKRAARKGEVSWRLKSSETIYGFAYWWTADLVPGVCLSTAPSAPRTHWEQLYFPLLVPMVVEPGQSVLLSLRSTSSEAAGTHLAWTAVHSGKDGKSIARQALDLNKGFLP